MKKYALLFFLCIFTIFTFAQESTKNSNTHQIGLNFGGVTGLGPSYRYWPGKFGLQITFLPIKIEENWQDPLHIKEFYQAFFPFTESQTFISAGLSGMYTVKQKPKFRLLTYFGNHILINENEEIYNLGGGFGISFDYRVSFSLLLGYAGYDITGNPLALPTAEVGVHVGLSKK